MEKGICHGCGQAMACKGKKAKWVVTQTGVMAVKCAYSCRWKNVSCWNTFVGA